MAPQQKVHCGTRMVASLGAHPINKEAWEENKQVWAFVVARLRSLDACRAHGHHTVPNSLGSIGSQYTATRKRQGPPRTFKTYEATIGWMCWPNWGPCSPCPYTPQIHGRHPPARHRGLLALDKPAMLGAVVPPTT